MLQSGARLASRCLQAQKGHAAAAPVTMDQERRHRWCGLACCRGSSNFLGHVTCRPWTTSLANISWISSGDTCRSSQWRLSNASALVLQCSSPYLTTAACRHTLIMVGAKLHGNICQREVFASRVGLPQSPTRMLERQYLGAPAVRSVKRLSGMPDHSVTHRM